MTEENPGIEFDYSLMDYMERENLWWLELLLDKETFYERMIPTNVKDSYNIDNMLYGLKE